MSGVVLTLIVLACAIWAVSRLGLYPIGADHTPTGWSRYLAGRAMDVYADRREPEMQNPTPPTADNLTEGFCEGVRGTLRVLRGKREGEEQSDAAQFNPPAPQFINRIRTIPTTGCSGSRSMACA